MKLRLSLNESLKNKSQRGDIVRPYIKESKKSAVLSVTFLVKSVTEFIRRFPEKNSVAFTISSFPFGLHGD